MTPAKKNIKPATVTKTKTQTHTHCKTLTCPSQQFYQYTSPLCPFIVSLAEQARMLICLSVLTGRSAKQKALCVLRKHLCRQTGFIRPPWLPIIGLRKGSSSNELIQRKRNRRKVTDNNSEPRRATFWKLTKNLLLVNIIVHPTLLTSLDVN